MKRRFAVPLAITVSLEVFVFSLNHKASAQVITKPDDPPPIFLPPAPEPVMENEGGSPERSKPDLPSPITLTTETPSPVPIDLPMNPIAAPPNPIVIEAGPRHFDSAGDGPGTGPVSIEVGLLDKAPRTVVRVPPAYPYQAKVEGLPGEVVVDFVVDYNGHVFNAHVVSSTNPIFEEATLRAVSQWRFEPGQRNGRAVRFRMRVPIQFHLDGH